jgi:hypothetical protein
VKRKLRESKEEMKRTSIGSEVVRKNGEKIKLPEKIKIERTTK